MISGVILGIGKVIVEIFVVNGFCLIFNGRRSECLEEMKISFEEEFEIDVKILLFDVSFLEVV